MHASLPSLPPGPHACFPSFPSDPPTRGRSQGSADVVFADASHARAAMSKYQGIALDGSKMVITLAGEIPKKLSSGIRWVSVPVCAAHVGGCVRERVPVCFAHVGG